MKKIFLGVLFLSLLTCKSESKTDLSAISTKPFTNFRVEDSEVIKRSDLWQPFEAALSSFDQNDYNRISPLVMDQNIPEIQRHVIEGHLTYEELVLFYLYRIKSYDRFTSKSLNSIISLNPNIVKQARIKDQQRSNEMTTHDLYGMPILLKDNINAKHMPTTAGAIALLDNHTGDAFIVSQLKNAGALILGKANMSEWAYFFCGDCPSGYSAVGGQTFNPYGRQYIDTGGSSSGSAVAVAANFCVAAIGSETSGSILSPSSQNATVGLKPTIGLVSRKGIIPISSTLDTAGPISKSVVDNAIVFNAITGYDSSDFKSKNSKPIDLRIFKAPNLKGKRFGAFKSLAKDSLYAQALNVLKSKGAKIYIIKEQEVDLPDFIRLLNLDMKLDLPEYLKRYGSSSLGFDSVESIVAFNSLEESLRAPYGQKLFQGIIKDEATESEFQSIKTQLNTNGKQFFSIPGDRYRLDGFLSINNYHAAYAAVAEYPALTVPMGFKSNGEPKGLTFITFPLQESLLYQWGYSYEQETKLRQAPSLYN